jgi:F-type H+-transporting ATPase subunit alpha
MADIPSEVRARIETAANLSGEDREWVLRIARKALAGFQPAPEPESEAELEIEPKADSGQETS